MNWNFITSENDFDNALKLSNEKTVVVFKHSTRCPVSSMAKRKLERDWNLDADLVDAYFLDLVKFRSVSNYISEKSDVKHESPQMIVYKNENVFHHASHHYIEVTNI